MVRVLALVLAGVLALPAVAQDKGYSAFVEKAKGLLTKDFRDPDDVRYRNLGVYQSNLGNRLVLCGEYNAKNAYGAFIGYRKFYATDAAAFVQDEPGDSLFSNLSAGYCDKKVASVK